MQVQNAALAAMKDEMFELAARFTRVTKERDYMEKALNRLQVSNIIIHLESLYTATVKTLQTVTNKPYVNKVTLTGQNPPLKCH